MTEEASKSRKHTTLEIDVIEKDEVGRKKVKERKREEPVDPPTVVENNLLEMKRKRRQEETVANSAVNELEEQERPLKSRRKKNKTGFPDPQDDPSLSAQASKALSYAFLQFRKPSKWKFSKARQNWLIRNVWSDVIPDVYLPLTSQYLSNVKGGVREKLVKDCKAILAASPVLSDETTEVQPASNAEKDSKYVRARALLDSLEVLQKSEPTT
ncbi:hypothetical protein GGX14DRAFT_415723 [Mycena pura]|uniref:WKF domain-containing protein n=1 Tax=Mycena pura TaxID=153505 RepID=A0AAD6YTI5_9AGAR|nr:hypothetical protein GGX14DRAFT_415723 [Mycena pura]